MLIYSTEPWCAASRSANSHGQDGLNSNRILPGTCLVSDGLDKREPILKYLLHHPDVVCGNAELYPFFDDDGVEASQWFPSLELKLISVLAKHCRSNDVKNEDVFERVMELTSDELTENGLLEFPTQREVRHKIIRLRALFLEFWNFVVAHELPFEHTSGKITTTPKYESYIAQETELEEYFRLHGLPGFENLHAIFLEQNAAYLNEEHMFYYLCDHRLFQLIDRYFWNNQLEESVFKWLVDYIKTNPVRKVEQLLEAISKAAHRMKRTEGDVRRIVRRRRLPFIRFKTFILDHKVEECWETRKLECCGPKHYPKMHAEAQRYFDSVNFQIYRLHDAFFVDASAALTPEELEANSFNLTTTEVTMDAIWRT